MEKLLAGWVELQNWQRQLKENQKEKEEEEQQQLILQLMKLVAKIEHKFLQGNVAI